MDINSRMSHMQDNLISQDPTKNPQCVITIILKKAGEENSGISSDLILDNYLDYYYIPQSSEVDGEYAPNLFLNKCGYTQILSAVNKDKEIRLVLCKDKPQGEDYKPPIKDNCNENCLDTPFGFKLSQILRNLNKMHQIQKDNFPITKELYYTSLSVTQKGFYIEKDGKIYLKFQFKVENNNNNLDARRILFKDILPKGLSVIRDQIYVDDKCVNSYNLDIEGRRIFIKLPMLRAKQYTTLSLLCSVDRCNLSNSGLFNVGAVCNVGSNYSSINTLNTNVVVTVSNAVCLRDII